jgi:hypothetical protein
MTDPTPDFRALLADDAYAASFQSMGQYRTALLKALATPPPEPPTDEELDALEEKLWNEYKTIGYLGEEFMYDSSFVDALSDYRAVLERWGHC